MRSVLVAIPTLLAAVLLSACGLFSAPEPPPTPAPGQVAIAGVVKQVSASDRVITLEIAVQGFDKVSVADDSGLRFRDERPATFQDLRPGTHLAVSGDPGPSGTLIARVILVDPASAPPGTVLSVPSVTIPPGSPIPAPPTVVPAP